MQKIQITEISNVQYVPKKLNDFTRKFSFCTFSREKMRICKDFMYGVENLPIFSI